ncbi:MAG TPA: glycine cleavage system protein GcvH [Candidatus Latescibacteria bacterium]|nr:glycine cleavage system protein GcvH [Candidatus Latescibacterota bacterium]
MALKELLFSDGHAWVLSEGETATIGMTEYIQEELGDILLVDLPEVGEKVTQGDLLGTIGGVETVYELLAPLSGEILEVNESLRDDPGLAKNDPYGEGWMVKIRLSDSRELDSLMAAEEYESMTGR